MDEFRKMVNGQDTMTLRRDRILTRGILRGPACQVRVRAGASQAV